MEDDVKEPLVVAEIEVDLATVVQYVDLPVLVRRKRASIDVDVGVDFDRRHVDAARLENRAKAAGNHTLAHAADHAARHQYVLHLPRGGLRSRSPQRQTRKLQPRKLVRNNSFCDIRCPRLLVFSAT